MIPFLDLKRKYKVHKKEINRAVSRVFQNGNFILGPELDKFEKSFAKYLGAKYAVGLNSGTDALIFSLTALGIGPGAEVITVANTFIATVMAIRAVGAKPVFVDVDPTTQNIDVTKIEGAITKNTKAILTVHLFGYPADMDAIMRLARKYKLKVVEDACQAHGAKFKDKYLGTIGDAGCFSFYPTKTLGGFGDGGAALVHDKNIAQKIKMLGNYGESEKYKSEIEGRNSSLDEIQAALLSWGLTNLAKWNKKREKLASLYSKNLKNLPIKLPLHGSSEYSRAWYLYVIQTPDRDKLRDRLLSKSIGTMIHYPIPITSQRAYSFLNYKESDLPVTSRLSREILSLPLYPELKESEVVKICKVIREFYGVK